MPPVPVPRCAILLGILGLLGSLGMHGPVRAAAVPSLSYNRDVQPLLAEYCLDCHGPDSGARKAGLRLDRPETARQGGKSGRPAIVPGDAGRSEMLRRLAASDPDEKMPPSRTGRKPTPAQVAVLRAWVEQGAVYEGHWAFRAPGRPALPRAPAGTHPVDAFVRARLKAAGLAPSPEADRRTLIRRLSLDLLGLPPAPSEVEAFVADRAPDAYERVVDRLLASPHFGERWGRHWLDLARYADSDGYEKDNPRPHAWLYRDWVIDAINRDVPFNQFTVEQLAGDLLPGATEAQRVATGFHRQTLINREGGVDQEEFRCKATVDRTHTTAAVWLGLTLGCAECHNHKYDPISQHEFYEFYAFFNRASDRDLAQPTGAEVAAYRAATNQWQKKLDTLAARVEAAGAPSAAAGVAPNQAGSRRAAMPADAQALEKLKADLEKHRAKKPAFKPTTAAVLGAEPRDTFIHVRGDFLQKGDPVRPGTPAFLPPLAARGEVPDRLDLARWLVAPGNPLAARVAVNHAWRHLFGRGLVASENDFGTRGDPPSHPELLDWLAVTLAAAPGGPATAPGLGWSRKALLRLVVTSATYRQSAAWRADVAARDPLNLLLARQGRWRVEAELVRDIALAASGLLNPRVGGPSFKPALPPDVAKLSYASGLQWTAATGEDRLRRGLYIHFQRTVPLPMLMAFDAPDANTTCTRRERSNSPLQALTLLNNEAFLECAQALGRRLTQAAPDLEGRLRHGFRLATGRWPTRAEAARLRDFWQGYRAGFQADEAATATALARVLLNLDETITRE